MHNAGRVSFTLRRGALIVLTALFLGLNGCDVPKEEEGRKVDWVMLTSPENGDENVPRLGPFTLELDRRVLPNSVNLDSVRLISGAVGAAFWLILEPVARVIRLEVYRNRPLEPEVTYRLVIEGLTDLDGLRQDSTFELFFRTGTEVGQADTLPQVGWSSVAEIFSAHCSSANCHGAKSPALDLDLSSAAGVGQSAIGVRSRQLPSGLISAEGARGALSLAGLNIVDAEQGAGQSARSYLMYKVLGDPHILGDTMPPPKTQFRPLSDSELKALSYWILSGASVN